MSRSSSGSPLTVDARLLQRHDVPGPRYTSYPTAKEFDSDFEESTYRQALALARGGLSLYTHLPFCESRCLYCACSVVITKKRSVAGDYLQRLHREIELVTGLLGTGRPVRQFHLGGGTPTYYSPEQLSDLMDQFRRHFRFEEGAELAIEVDPRVTTREHLEVLARHGFNRMSLGIQDFDPRVQEAVNRVQSVEQTRSLMEYGRQLGFSSLNVDLIYGLPHQTVASFERTIAQVIELDPDRLAVYSFALVPWLKHHQKFLPEDGLPTGLAKFELLEVARRDLQSVGYVDIGMDHFAKPADALAVAQRSGRLWRNFMGYTPERSDELIGFGASAIGFVMGNYVQNTKTLSGYYRAIDQDRLPVERGYSMRRDDLIRLDVIQSWMCNFRIDAAEVEARHGIDFWSYFGPERERLSGFEREGFLEITGDGVTALELGRLFPRNVAMVFDRYLSEDAPDAQRFSRTV